MKLLECAGLSILGYSAAGGERVTRSKKLGCNKPAGVFACLNAPCAFGTATYYPRSRYAKCRRPFSVYGVHSLR